MSLKLARGFQQNHLHEKKTEARILGVNVANFAQATKCISVPLRHITLN